MKLWLPSQSTNTSYDTYDSLVVAAESEDVAKYIRPSGHTWQNNEWRYYTDISNSYYSGNGDWAHPKDVSIEYIGEAREGTEAGVILASFNAG